MRRGEGDSETPMIEIFGGVFALMLVLFLIVNLFTQSALVERLESAAEEGLYRVGWGASGAGFVVIAFPGEVRIVETGETVETDAVCSPGSAFTQYVQRIYGVERQQLIFAIVEGGVGTMAVARNCMMELMPNQTILIGWIIANNELLKSVSLNDIPAHIQRAVE